MHLLSAFLVASINTEARSRRTLYKMQKLVQFISPVPFCSHILFLVPGEETSLTYCSLFMLLLSLPSLLFESAACSPIKAALLDLVLFLFHLPAPTVCGPPPLFFFLVITV